ncbi:MAG: hypothetical protein P8M72_11350 [Gammaproteobacteria bacterium]|nr:hypothetical protein [Gammaproteobacteria bacterium]
MRKFSPAGNCRFWIITEPGDVNVWTLLTRFKTLRHSFQITSNFCVALITTCLLIFSLPASGQSSSQLRALFFDQTYPDSTNRILLSSGNRETFSTASTVSTDELQPEPTNAEILDDIRNYEANINGMIEESGTFAQGLSQEYMALGTLYLQAGDQEQSVETFENAMHIQRVNEGLFSLNQIQIVRKLIEANKATRNFGEADKYHEYLYYLMAQNLEPGDDDLITATLEWADWNLEAYRRLAFNLEDDLAVSSNNQSVGASMLRRGELVAIEDDKFSEIRFIPRSSMLGSSSGLMAQSYTADQLVDPRLKTADELYEKLLETDESNQEVLRKKANIIQLFNTQIENQIENNIFRTTLSTTTNRLVRSVSFLRKGYADNRESLTTIAETKEQESPEAAANAWLDLGDWELLFERTQRAETAYSNARDILLTAGRTETEITRFISPEQALFIPQYIDYEDTRKFQSIPEETDIPYIGYIDISFNKRRNGTLRNIRFESSSENTGQQVQRRLRSLLRNVKVRPLFIDGELQEQANIQVRYYYSY